MPLFAGQISRKPNHYPWTQEYIDALWAGHWTPNEFNFKSDYHQFKTDMTEEERDVITRTLSAIGQIEIAVKSFWANLGNNLPHPGISDLGYVMAHSEVIHNQAYEKLLDVLGLSHVFEQNMDEPVVAGRVGYLRKHLEQVSDDPKRQYIYSIILFTLFVENVSLFSQFYIILNFNRFKNVLKDTAQQVQYTKNEESLHSQVGIKIINTLREEYPELFDDALVTRIQEACEAAVQHESAMIDWILQGYTSEKLNSDILKAYITERMNDSLAAIDMPLIENNHSEETKAEYAWMDEMIHGETMTDFFHKRPVEYAKNSQVIDAMALV